MPEAPNLVDLESHRAQISSNEQQTVSAILAPASWVQRADRYPPVSGSFRLTTITRTRIFAMRFFIAFRAFFAVLFSRDRAIEVKQLLLLPPAPVVDPKRLPAPTLPSAGKQADAPVGETVAMTSAPAVRSSPPKSSRSDAITLLATLQREARFVDLVQESLDQYTDAQIGAAARDVLRDTKKCLNQLLSIEPLAKEGEGAQIRLPANPSPVQWKLVGGVKDSGTIAHAGWKATQITMPTWTGSAEDQGVIAPVEVE